MDTVKNVANSAGDAVNSATESLQGKGAEASKEANKQTAQSDQASLGTRASAGKDAVSDKIDQTSHEAKS